jgi:hypothetical protein
MKKILPPIFLLFFLQPLFAQYNSSYTISEVYVEMNIGYESYYAEIDSLYLTEFGEVKTLYKKTTLSDIGYGKYIVQLEHIKSDLFKIIGTGYVLKIRFANSMTFSRFEDCILDISGFFGTISKKD